MAFNFGWADGGDAAPAAWSEQEVISAPINMGDGHMRVGKIKTGAIKTEQHATAEGG